GDRADLRRPCDPARRLAASALRDGYPTRRNGAYASSSRFSPSSSNATVASASEPDPETDTTTPSPHRSCWTVSPADTAGGSRLTPPLATDTPTRPRSRCDDPSLSISRNRSLGISERNR